MIRLKQLEPDSIVDRAKDEVRANFIVFAVLCATIRFVPIVLRKIFA